MNNKAERIMNSLYNYYCSTTTNEAVQQKLTESKDAFISCLYNLISKDVDFGEKYIHAAGAQKHHHNHEFGLLEHSFELCMELAVASVQHNLEFTGEEIGRIAFMHDLCKVDTYIINPDKTIFCDGDKYQKHGISSVEIANKYNMQLSKKETVCILAHMSKWAGAKDHAAVAADMELVKAFFSYTGEVRAVQQADMAACKQYDFTLAIVEEV